MKVPVHCCCNPDKRLGWLEVPDNLARPGVFYIPMRSASGFGQLEVQLALLLDPHPPANVILAAKSGHEPVETWEKVPGFTRDEDC
jgi:hypothetical protein